MIVLHPTRGKLLFVIIPFLFSCFVLHQHLRSTKETKSESLLTDDERAIVSSEYLVDSSNTLQEHIVLPPNGQERFDREGTFCFYVTLGKINFDRWSRGLWNERLNESETPNCMIPSISGDPQFPNALPFSGCKSPIFSSLDSNGFLHIFGDFCVNATVEYQIFKEREETVEFWKTLVAFKKYTCSPTTVTVKKGIEPLIIEDTKHAEMVKVFCQQRENWHIRPVYQQQTEKSQEKVWKEKFHKKPPSVQVIVLDSTSRFSFLYRMNHTSRWMEDQKIYGNNQTKVFQFFRHNIVGISTYQNMPQLFGGCKQAPFFQGEVTTLNGKTIWLCNDTLWLSNYFMDLGYVVAESTIIRPPLHGKAHHRLDFRRDFCLYPKVNPAGPNYEDSEGKLKFGWVETDPRAHCLGGRVPETHLMDYSLQFHEMYRNSPRFIYNHYIGNHEGSQNGLRIVDKEFETFLSQLDLSETFLFIVGDHGVTYGTNYVRSAYGQTEYRNPVFFLLAPQKYLTPEMEQFLTKNEQRITTPWDIYHTILSLPLPHMNTPPHFERKFEGGIPPPSHSLVNEEVPQERDCDSAGIHMNFCQCFQFILQKQITATQKNRFLSELLQRVNELGFKSNPELCHQLLPRHFELSQLWKHMTKEGAYKAVATVKKDPSGGRTGELLAFVGYWENSQVTFVKRLSAYEREPCKSEEGREWCVCKEGNQF